MNYGNVLDDKENVYLLLNLIVVGIRLVVTLLGLVGNIISITIWSRSHLKSSSSVVLVALAVCDTLVILCGLWYRIPTNYLTLQMYRRAPLESKLYINFICDYYVRWSFIASKVVYLMAETATQYLTAIMTIERYICICHPFWFNERSSYNRTCKFVAMAMVFSVLYHFIVFWEFRVVGHPHLTTGVERIVLYYPEVNQLLRNKLYIEVKYIWMFILFDYLLPLTCIITLNTITYIKLKRINKERRTMTDFQKNENKLTRMILYVVVEFLIFTSMSGFITMGRIFPNTLGSYLDSDNQLSNLSQLFLFWQMQGLFNSLNSSVNFVTYVSSWPPFRTTFMKMFSCHRNRERSSSTSPSNHNDLTSNVEMTSV